MVGEDLRLAPAPKIRATINDLTNAFSREEMIDVRQLKIRRMRADDPSAIARAFAGSM